MYPKKECITYNITYELNCGINNEENISSYTIEDSNFELKSPYRKGYDFAGWYTTPTFSKSSLITSIQTKNCESIKLYAKWVPHTYVINYEDDGENSNVDSYMVTDTDIVLQEPQRKGYKFDGWYADKEYLEPISKIFTSDDTFCELIRFGGEEFLIVFAGYHLLDTLDSLYQRMSENIKALQLRSGEGAVHEYITLSFGAYISHFDEDFVLEERIRRADEQLYISKNNGRNTITVESEY